MELKHSTIIFFSFSLIIIISIIPKIECSIMQDAQPRRLYDNCSDPITTFPPNNTYNSTINTLFEFLSSNASATSTGFYTASVHDNTINTTFNGYFLCRGDLDNVSCHACVSNAQTKKCPASYWQVIYYNNCMLKYSNETLHGVLSLDPEFRQDNRNYEIQGDRDDYKELLGKTLRFLAFHAANDNQIGRKFATTSVNITTLISVYAAAQCKPDLSVGDCHICLTSVIGKLKVQTDGENFVTPSCNIRFEGYPFFNGPGYYLQSPPPSTPMNTGTTNSGKKNISSLSTGLIIGIVVAAAIIAALLPTIGVCLVNKKIEKYHIISMQQVAGENDLTVESLRYDLTLLQHATNNFSKENKLGEGGFGLVYKGTLSNGQDIAVKRLSRSSNQGEEQFKNEVLLVAKLQHRNLVRLLGFCLTEEEKLLIYEFVPNTSLDKYIFDHEKSKLLDWKKRYDIIGGIARGMLYLHEDSRLKIIHRDLKASNILLDSDMNPKVSDFGTARIFGTDQTQGRTSNVVGTLGYMAPEYVMHGQFSVKSDVYSFGILVLEIICGEKNFDFYQENGELDLISFAWKHWRDGTHLEFVDPRIRDQSSIEEVIRCMNLGLLCVQDADQRPFMSTIVLMLNSFSTTIPLPTKPTLIVPTNTHTPMIRETNLSTKYSTTQFSSTDVSITMPR